MAKRYKKITNEGVVYKEGEIYDENYRATNSYALSVMECVKRNPERWQLIEENEFVLPEKWWVRVTEENEDVLNDWLDYSKGTVEADMHLVGVAVGSSRWTDGKAFNPINVTRGFCYDFGNEITYEQFKKYVLKEETMEKVEKWSKGTYVLFLEDLWHYKKGDIDIITKAPNPLIELPNEIEISRDREADGQIKWFATKEEAEAYLKEERGEIIGYKLKEDCEKFREAANSIVEEVVGFSSPYLDVESKDVPHSNSNTVKALKEAGVLDLWFEPVYEAKLSLPKINGYDGKVDGDMVKYGCATFSVNKLKRLIDCHELSGCRYIKSIKLSSGVEMTIDEIKQIVEYFDSL